MFTQTSNEKIILGIDPGIERLGWGIIKKNGGEIERIDSGVKKTLKTQKQSERLFEIQCFLDDLIKKEKPNMMSTEKLFFSKNVKTALSISETRGVILATAQKHSLPIVEFTPLQVKTAVCGYGKASKEDVARMLKLSIKLPQKTLLDDETDALAIAITAAFYRSFP
ncbi:MAG TPA: crossover junction endodeoxyribonuclease RuvC [Candidatus Paceibacterota bacterium]